MGSGDWLGNIFQTFGLPVAGWAAFCAMLVHWWKLKNERDRDRHSEKTGDWSRLRAEIKRLDERCDHLQSEVDECRKREGEWMSRAISAEAAQLGEGRANEAAQIIVSKERTKGGSI